MPSFPADRLTGVGFAPGLALAFVALLAGTTVLYAVDVFQPSGGLVWVPFYAAVVGFAAAGVVGWLERGVVAALVLAYAPFLGFHLEWGLVEISSRPLTARLAYFVRPDGLAALALEAVVIGGVGYVVGRVVRRLAVEVQPSAPAE